MKKAILILDISIIALLVSTMFVDNNIHDILSSLTIFLLMVSNFIGYLMFENYKKQNIKQPESFFGKENHKINY